MKIFYKYLIIFIIIFIILCLINNIVNNKKNIENFSCKCKNGLSLVCPHAGCIVEMNKETKEFVCPCHGSRFSSNGKLLQGPAKTGLRKCSCNK